MNDWEMTDEERISLEYKISTSPAPYAFTDKDGTLIDPSRYSFVDTKNVAKAAQKKLVEWELETCREHVDETEALPTRRVDCIQCWQELRKGVGI